MVIGFAAYGQTTYTVECKGVEATCGSFWLDSVTADTIQVEIIDMNYTKVVVPGIVECTFDTTYHEYVHPLTKKSYVKMYVYPRYKIKLDLTGFKRDAYFIRLIDENVFGTCKLNKLIVKS